MKNSLVVFPVSLYFVLDFDELSYKSLSTVIDVAAVILLKLLHLNLFFLIVRLYSKQVFYKPKQISSTVLSVLGRNDTYFSTLEKLCII